MGSPGKSIQGLEDNSLAILDSSGVGDARDVHDDRLSFLEAVRAACLASVSPSPPTWKMYDAILHILLYGRSLELTMASYLLLTELDKHYPRVYWKLPNDSIPSSIANGELIVNKEAWSPFWFGSDKPYGEATGDSRDTKELYDSLKFSILLEEIAFDAKSGIKITEKMMLFQYLIYVLEADFLPLHASYKETLDWDLLRESMLCMLLASRKLNYKSVVRICMSLISTRCYHENNISDMVNDAKSISAELLDSCNVGLPFVYTEILRATCAVVQKLLVLIMELDVVRKEADSLGLVSRSDGFRFPIVDTILDELTYNKDQISLFLQARTFFCFVLYL
ncbi:hypothetical protein HPP92_003507 [Vanilla planifolia]|uniref:Uncharacterized protein n=1 Tax=Vanilla planifolia TaxID=51239 RepID=A0A835S347_VANPL|nr:hypothetical protein HPP92_003507 [Vanilla planifolia]